MKKRFVTLVLTLAVVSLCACGNNETLSIEDASTGDVATTDDVSTEDTNDAFWDAVDSGDLETASAIANGTEVTTSNDVSDTQTTDETENEYADYYGISTTKYGSYDLHTTVYFLDTSNDFIDWSKKTSDIKLYGDRIFLNLAINPEIECEIGIDDYNYDAVMKSADESGVIYVGTINGMDTCIYHEKDKVFLYSNIEEASFLYLFFPEEGVDLTDEQIAEALTNFISQTAFVKNEDE